MIKRIAACAVLCATAAQAQNRALPPETERQLAREIYKEMVEVKSGFTTGSTTPIAEAVARRLKAAGFPDADIFVGGAIPTKANVVVRYRGTGRRRPILLLAHIDVVEAKPEDWSMDPFAFVEKDGYFYGRGTGDDKAQAAIWIANLMRYKREGYKPDRDIIVALTADEEGGGPYNGVNWLLKNKRELIDAELALNEGGWGEALGDTKISNDIQVSEKYVINYRFEVHNKGGHSSLPVDDNAIYHLAGALDRLAKFGFPLATNDVTRAYFRAMSKIEKGPISADLAKVADGDTAAMTRVAKASTPWNATLRTTCVATQLEGGHAKNALPQLAAANVNCRVLPDDQVEFVTRDTEAGGRRHRGERDGGRHSNARPRVTHAGRPPAGSHGGHELGVARRADGPDDGDGRDGRDVSASGRHSDVRRAGHLLRPRGHSIPRPR